jgi:hypothetical protein
MAQLRFGNESVIEGYKPDEGVNEVLYKSREDLGKRTTTMSLNEVDIDDNPSRSMNLALAIRFWGQESDKPPLWVEGDDELLVALVADHFGCPIGQPKSWKEG